VSSYFLKVLEKYFESKCIFGVIGRLELLEYLFGGGQVGGSESVEVIFVLDVEVNVSEG
jgi:hypothetical protein